MNLRNFDDSASAPSVAHGRPRSAGADDDALRAFVAERDAPCPSCAYSLRGLTMNVCPECGEALELRVGLVEPKLGSFIGGLVGLAAGAGFHAFVLGWATWVRASGRFGPDVRVLIPLMIGLVACGVCLWLWMAKRRRIRKLSAPWRYALVGACWGVSLATAMLFFAVVG